MRMPSRLLVLAASRWPVVGPPDSQPAGSRGGAGPPKTPKVRRTASLPSLADEDGSLRHPSARSGFGWICLYSTGGTACRSRQIMSAPDSFEPDRCSRRGGWYSLELKAAWIRARTSSADGMSPSFMASTGLALHLSFFHVWPLLKSRDTNPRGIGGARTWDLSTRRGRADIRLRTEKQSDTSRRVRRVRKAIAE